jgi:hypothetical protein
MAKEKFERTKPHLNIGRSRFFSLMSREICTYSPVNTRPEPNVAVMSPELLSSLSQVNATGFCVPRTLPEPVPAPFGVSQAASASTASDMMSDFFMAPVWRAAVPGNAGQTTQALSG